MMICSKEKNTNSREVPGNANERGNSREVPGRLGLWKQQSNKSQNLKNKYKNKEDEYIYIYE